MSENTERKEEIDILLEHYIAKLKRESSRIDYTNRHTSRIDDYLISINTITKKIKNLRIEHNIIINIK